MGKVRSKPKETATSRRGTPPRKSKRTAAAPEQKNKLRRRLTKGPIQSPSGSAAESEAAGLLRDRLIAARQALLARRTIVVEPTATVANEPGTTSEPPAAPPQPLPPKADPPPTEEATAKDDPEDPPPQPATVFGWIHGVFERHWMVLPALAIAAFLRFTRLFPTYLYGDDAEYATVATYLSQHPLYLGYPELEQIGATPFVSQPPLMLYLFAIVSKFTGNMEEAVILTNAFLGLATVALVYAIGVATYGRIAGAVGSALFAVVPLHVDMSRKGFLDVGLTFFASLAILAYLLWNERPTVTRACMTGLAAAATTLSKLPGFLVLFALLGAIGLTALRHVAAGFMTPTLATKWRPEAIKRQATAAGLPILLATGLYVGLLWYLQATANLWSKIGWNVGRVTQTAAAAQAHETTFRPWHWYFTDPTFGIVFQYGILFCILALAGAVLAIRRALTGAPSQASRVVVVIFPLLILAFFTLSARKESFYIVPALPFFAIWAALPIDKLYRMSRHFLDTHDRRLHARQLRTIGAAVLLIAGAIAWGPAAASFERSVVPKQGFGHGLEDAAYLIEQRGPHDGQIGSLLGRFTIHFYNENPTYHWHVEHAIVEDRIRNGDIRFIVYDDYLGVGPEQRWMLDVAERHNARPLEIYRDDTDRVRVIVFELFPDPTFSEAATE